MVNNSNNYKKVTDEELNSLKQSIIVRGSQIDKKTLRFVTHLGVSSESMDLALKKIDYVINEYKQKQQ